MQKIIFFIGMPGSGKGTAAKAARKLGFSVYAFGDIFREESRRRYKDTSAEHIEKTVKWFHTKRRPKLLASRMWQRVRKKRKIIIDGCRNKLQYTHFCKLAGQKPIIVYVYAPRSFRYKLMRKRARQDTSSYQYLLARERRELKQGLAWMISQAKYRISNRSSKKTLTKNTIKLLKKLPNT